MTRKLLINGRFLAGEKTAVNKVAFNLTDALCRNSGTWEVEVVVPRILQSHPVPSYWNVRAFGARKGIAWEQCDLPKIRHAGVVAGFFNTVPLRGQGYVTLLHDAHVFSTPQSYAPAIRLWRQFLSRRAGAGGNHLLTVSEHSKACLQERGIGSPDRIGVVYNGLGQVGQSAPDGRILSRLGLSEQKPYCLAVSTLLAHKNIPMLLKAFADPRLTEVNLVLFGKTDRRAFVAAGHPVPENVIFSGLVKEAELAALYRGSLAVCVPSTHEGFGMPALEGMAAGKPLIVAPCGALPEIVGDTGLAAAPHDVDGWADAVLKLGTDEVLRDRLGQAAKARAAMFTWDAAGQAALGHLDRWFTDM